MCVTWVFTVGSVKYSSVPTSLLDLSRAMARSTSSSRGVKRFSASGTPQPAGAGGRRTKFSISRWVTVEARSVTPAAHARTALAKLTGAAVVSRNPNAPERSA